jgi:hypothetical protein
MCINEWAGLRQKALKDSENTDISQLGKYYYKLSTSDGILTRI